MLMARRSTAKNELPDPDLPPLPELVHSELRDARIVAVLRDPVRRAISAYHHWMRQGNLSPLAGLGNCQTDIANVVAGMAAQSTTASLRAASTSLIAANSHLVSATG